MNDKISTITVPPVGPVPARIMLIGECPGESEEKHGIPFCGLAGRVLDDILEETGIKREECYITNLCKNRPKDNLFANFDTAYLSQAKAELEREITIVSPNIIVCLGEHSFHALTGLKGITLWRGSILETKYGKLIPTIHPAAISREWKFRPLVVADFCWVKAESEYKEVIKQHRDILIRPAFSQVIDFLTHINKDTKVAFDIEVETQQISCISFAISATYAISIPFWFGASGSFWSEEQELEIWRLIKQVLESNEIPKIAQNAQYDMTILRDKYNIRVNNLWLDTMIAFHAIYAELPKALYVISSIYTDVPYYKFLRKTDDMDKFFEYNALDALVTYECAHKIYAEMQEFGVTEFYYEHMHSLIQPLLDISSTGVLIDTQVRKKVFERVTQELAELQEELDKLVGHPLNVNSPKQMKEWLYNELKLPVKSKLRKGKEEATVSTDEDALESLYALTGLESLRVVLKIRESKKLLSTYLEVNYDKDTNTKTERARTSYLITGTETGRLSSRETVYGTGTNLQNIPKGIIRQMFIPDEGKVFINADLSQAEARVVAYLAGEDRLIEVFKNGGDIHTKNAANIFRKGITDVTKEERELAKRIIHASNYGMGAITFSRNAGVSVAEAKRLLNQYFTEYPRIKLWHMSIANQLRKSRTLITPLGRKRTFFNMWNESLLKEAYAYIPQSTVADVLNMGLRRFYEQSRSTDIQILLQIHDAILCQAPQEQVEEVCISLRKHLSIPVVINNRTLVIPVDISVGKNWNELRKV